MRVDKKWVIYDNEVPRDAPEEFIGSFDSEEQAAYWLEYLVADRAKVRRGGYSLIGPADDTP